MARLLVIILLAVNLLFFGWSRWIGDSRAQLVAATPSPATRPTQATPVPCASLGPFVDATAALQAREKLASGGLNARQRDVTETQHDGWWVHVDNADADSQQRTLDALRRAGISDASVMPDSPEFRVSVGIFSSAERAGDRAARVRGLRLDAAVSERLRDQSVMWLDMPGVAPETLRDGRLAGAGLELGNLRVESCPGAHLSKGAPRI